MVDVKLTPSEMLLAASVGVMRQVTNLRDKREHRYGCDPKNAWTNHIEGACGEMAVAKAAGIFWSGSLGDLQADDVGKLQVRTAFEHYYRLVLHPSDPDDRAFVLVTGAAPEFKIRGWIWGEHGKNERWWSDPSGENRPAFFVPTRELRPFSDLVGKVAVNG